VKDFPPASGKNAFSQIKFPAHFQPVEGKCDKFSQIRTAKLSFEWPTTFCWQTFFGRITSWRRRAANKAVMDSAPHYSNMFQTFSHSLIPFRPARRYIIYSMENGKALFGRAEFCPRHERSLTREETQTSSFLSLSNSYSFYID